MPTVNWRVDIADPAERRRILAEVERLAPWYHSFDLADWLVIEGRHASRTTQEALDRLGFPERFDGQSVLDVGCNSGLYSFLALTRGAARVVGVEIVPKALAQAALIGELLELEVEFIEGDVHEVGSALGQFDTVICSGLLYHIHDPTNVLLRLASVCTGTLLLESEFLLEPELSETARFIEGTYMEDATNWWIFGPTCMERMVRACGFRTAEFRGFHREPRGALSPEGIPMGGRGFLIATK